MKTFITVICVMLISSTSFASTNRANDLMAEDSYDRLQKISDTKADLKVNEAALSALEMELSKELVKAKKQKSAEIILGVGAAGFAIIAIAYPAVNKTYKAAGYEASNVIVRNMLKAIGVSTLITATGATKYALNANDAKELAEKVRLAKINNQKIQENLNREIIQLCKVDSRHALCY